MNPVIIIPSYWAGSVGDPESTMAGVYDHATQLDIAEPELERCLSSLEQVRGVVRTVILLVAPPADEPEARWRVEEICEAHPNLNLMVVGTPEANVVQDALAAISPDLDVATVSLQGYGAIKNMGLAVAAVLGHDVAVFLDDDEIVLSPEFLMDAVYGLGHLTRQELPVIAKSGFFLNDRDSPYAIDDHPPAWYDRWWNKRPLFNDWMDHALDAPRISRSNILTGGCFALHAEAFTRVGFDPYITRGEDLDYLLNLRLYGLNVWFDNQWYVSHRPPNTPSRAARFEQDVYRWYYEVEKLGVANDTMDLRKVSASSLMPYPGPWLSNELGGRIVKTALARSVFYPERGAYLRILTRGRREARTWAQEHSSDYLRFQTYWPQVMVQLWNSADVAQNLKRASSPEFIAEREARLEAERLEAEAAERAARLEAEAQAAAAAAAASAEVSASVDAELGIDPPAIDEVLQEDDGMNAELVGLPQIEPPEGGSMVPSLVPRAHGVSDAPEEEFAVPVQHTVTEDDIDAFLAEVRAASGKNREESQVSAQPAQPAAEPRDLEAVAAELSAPPAPHLPPDQTLTQWAAISPDDEAWSNVAVPEEEADAQDEERGDEAGGELAEGAKPETSALRPADARQADPDQTVLMEEPYDTEEEVEKAATELEEEGVLEGAPVITVSEAPAEVDAEQDSAAEDAAPKAEPAAAEPELAAPEGEPVASEPVAPKAEPAAFATEPAPASAPAFLVRALQQQEGHEPVVPEVPAEESAAPRPEEVLAGPAANQPKEVPAEQVAFAPEAAPAPADPEFGDAEFEPSLSVPAFGSEPEPAPELPARPPVTPAAGADLSVPDLSINVSVPSFLEDPVANLAADPRRGLDPDLAPESVGYELDMSEPVPQSVTPAAPSIPAFLRKEPRQAPASAEELPAASERSVRRAQAEGWDASDYSMVDDVAELDDPLPSRTSSSAPLEVAPLAGPEGYDEMLDSLPPAEEPRPVQEEPQQPHFAAPDEDLSEPLDPQPAPEPESAPEPEPTPEPEADAINWNELTPTERLDSVIAEMNRGRTAPTRESAQAQPAKQHRPLPRSANKSDGPGIIPAPLHPEDDV